MVALATILMRAEPALNRMTGETQFLVRISMILLAVGALAQAGNIILMDYVPSINELIINAGVAALLCCERRIRVIVPSKGFFREQ